MKPVTTTDSIVWLSGSRSIRRGVPPRRVTGLGLVAHEGDAYALGGILRLELEVPLAIRDEATSLTQDLDGDEWHRVAILIIYGTAEDVQRRRWVLLRSMASRRCGQAGRSGLGGDDGA